jgi:hypothetical protein
VTLHIQQLIDSIPADTMTRPHSAAVAANLLVRAKPKPTSAQMFERGEHQPTLVWFGVDLAKNDSARQTETAGASRKAAGPVRAAAAGSPVWRGGNDVQMAERVGLWHYRTPKTDIREGCAAREARDASTLFFAGSEYRPAAPGTKPGDPYDESRYAPQPKPGDPVTELRLGASVSVIAWPSRDRYVITELHGNSSCSITRVGGKATAGPFRAEELVTA